MSRRRRVVVMGFMGACPIAGVVWQHVHYIEGLRRLGIDVYYIEDSARITYNPETWEVGEDYTHAAAVLDRLGRQYGFDGRWAYRARSLPEMPTAGLPAAKIRELYAHADATLSICGSAELNDDILRSPNLIYVESDPGVEQIKIDQGDAETIGHIKAHHHRFTFGESVGTPDFPVPLHGVVWHPTRQPVVTDLWQAPDTPPPDAKLTSIANWNTSGKKDIAWRGDTYLWSKSREFLRFVGAPQRAGEPFELATDIKEDATRALFLANGWRLGDPHALSINDTVYQQYIQRSKGEFTVAKDQYVRLRTGWFSDRSACYLAAGRPVITQETGFSDHLPTGRGLLPFGDLDEVAAHVRAINADPAAHRRAARAIAREHFEAEDVLRRLLETAGV